MLKTGVILAALASAENVESQQDMVNRINAMQTSWTAGISPRFTGGRRMSQLLGASQNYEDMQEKIATGELPVVQADPSMAVPDNFDSATYWPYCANIINDIRDQSNCGCCWAFGTVSAATDRYCIATKDSSVTFSSEDACFCTTNLNGCNGGTLSTSWNHIKNAGVVTGGQQNNTGPTHNLCSAFSLPHCHHHGPQGNDPYPAEGTPGCPSQKSPRCPKACDSQAVAPHTNWAGDKYSFTGSVNSYGNEAAIQQAIMTAGPVATAFTVYSDFENYVSGIYTHTTGSYEGGHAVRFVGWGVENNTKYWKVANSWNPYWGENGFFRIIRGVNECNIERQGMASADTVTWTNPHA